MIHVLPDNLQIYVIFFNSKLGLSWLKYFLKKQSSPLTPVEKCSLHYHSLYAQRQDKECWCSHPPRPIALISARALAAAGLSREHAGGQ